MDSHFINFDGRSVHDMIELLLVASGDPEAVRRLQESINAVDQRTQSSISVVNAAIEQLETSKQDAGFYTENGGGFFGTAARFENGSNVGKLIQATQVRGIRIYGQHVEDSQGYIGESLVFNSDTKTIKQYVQNSSDNIWNEVATYSADEDTGWNLLENTDIRYRKKNGFISYNLAVGVTNYSFTEGSWTQLGTMPVGFRPKVNTMATFWYRKTSSNKFSQMLCQFVTDGRIQVFGSETLSSSDINSTLLSITFPA